jgi:hypothetical protein
VESDPARRVALLYREARLLAAVPRLPVERRRETASSGTATADEILAKVKLVQTNIKRLVDNNAKSRHQNHATLGIRSARPCIATVGPSAGVVRSAAKAASAVTSSGVDRRPAGPPRPRSIARLR